MTLHLGFHVKNWLYRLHYRFGQLNWIDPLFPNPTFMQWHFNCPKPIGERGQRKVSIYLREAVLLVSFVPGSYRWNKKPMRRIGAFYSLRMDTISHSQTVVALTHSAVSWCSELVSSRLWNGFNLSRVSDVHWDIRRVLCRGAYGSYQHFDFPKYSRNIWHARVFAELALTSNTLSEWARTVASRWCSRSWHSPEFRSPVQNFGT